MHCKNRKHNQIQKRAAKTENTRKHRNMQQKQKTQPKPEILQVAQHTTEMSYKTTGVSRGE